MFKAIATPNAPKPGGAYSQAIIAGPFLFTAGVGPVDPVSGQVVGQTIAEQTRQVMVNLQAILKEAGLDFRQVVKATVHLQHLARDFSGFNDVYQEFFQPPYPARTTVGSTLNGILVEIDLVAMVDGES
jgi:2-iminobutanoate/2-iminopropanoate deaminase